MDGCRRLKKVEEGEGREGKRRKGKGREGKGREGKGREAKGREGKGSEAKRSEAKGSEAKRSEASKFRLRPYTKSYGWKHHTPTLKCTRCRAKGKVCYSFTSQRNLSRFRHNMHPRHPQICPGTPHHTP